MKPEPNDIFPDLEFECPICRIKIPLKDFDGGTCKPCADKGFWIDPAGGVHHDDLDSDEFEDPARMYE